MTNNTDKKRKWKQESVYDLSGNLIIAGILLDAFTHDYTTDTHDNLVDDSSSSWDDNNSYDSSSGYSSSDSSGGGGW